MENKSTANKWLIAAVIVMSIIVVAMATWIIVDAMHKNSDSSSSVKTSQTKKNLSDSLEKLAVKARSRQMRRRKNIKISEPKATVRAFV